MAICTIVEFREAMLHPKTALQGIEIEEVEIDTISRTRHFVECYATMENRRVMLYAPISPTAMSLARGAERTLRGVESRAISPLLIYEDALLLNNGRRVAIIIERPLRGTPLSEMLFTLQHSTLKKGFEEFCNILKENNISHNNLHADNIIVDNTSAWHCIRQYYSTTPTGGDSEALAAIEALIERHALSDGGYESSVHDILSSYQTNIALTSYRQRVEEGGLVGFDNEQGERVIECKYGWASDFVEGRATIATPDGRMGLIDSDGHEIIEPRFEELEYDCTTGHSWVCHEGLWAEFDYVGKQLSDWSNED